MKKSWLRDSFLQICVLLVFMIFFAEASHLLAQDRAARRPPDKVTKNALVIGNSAYVHTSPLRNPGNDARAVGNTLEQLGFEVITLIDANRRRIDEALRRFGRNLRDNNGVGLFYYAGHGIQVGGENFLLPVDINPSTEADIIYDAVPVGKLLGQMEAAGNGMNIVILDACRNNPFARSFRSGSRGLAQVIAPTGSFISYATAPGNVASDGEGDNGLFTAKLLEHMVTPGLKLEDIFKRVRSDVQRDSNNQQVPWDSSSVTGDFFFVPAKEEAKREEIAQEPPPSSVPLPLQDLAAQAWGIIEGSSDPAVFRAFIDKFPDTPQRQLAELKLMILPSSEPENKPSVQIAPKIEESSKATITDHSSGENDRYRWTAKVVEDKEKKLIWQRIDSGERIFSGAQTYCNQLSLDEVDNWRLPEFEELSGLLEGKFSPEIFERLTRGSYWALSSSGTTEAFNPWSGTGGGKLPFDRYNTLCVRDTEYAASGTINLYSSIQQPTTDRVKEGEAVSNHLSGENIRYRWTNEIVEDKEKKLIWQRQAEGSKSYPQALSYCKNLDLEGSSDWRLPDMWELQDLFDVNAPSTPTPGELLPNSAFLHWSSTSLGQFIRLHNPVDDSWEATSENSKDRHNVICVRDTVPAGIVSSGTVNLFGPSNSSAKTEKKEILPGLQEGIDAMSYQELIKANKEVIGCGFFHVGCSERPLTLPAYQADFHIKGYRRVNLWGKDRPWTDTQLKVEKGDRVYIYGTGTVTTCLGCGESRNLSQQTISYRTSENDTPSYLGRFYNYPLGSVAYRRILHPAYPGKLYLAIRDWDAYPPPNKYYDDNSGLYILDIFVIDQNQEEGFKVFRDALFKANPEDSNARAYLGN